MRVKRWPKEGRRPQHNAPYCSMSEHPLDHTHPPQAGHSKTLALALMALASLSLAVVLTIAAAIATPLPGDVAIARVVQSWRAPWLDTLMRAVSFLGDDAGAIGSTVAVAGALAAWRRWPDAAAFLGVLAFDVALRLPKALIDRPRPAEDVVRVLESGGSGSFPSGHAFHAVLFWGLVIAVLLPRIQSARLRWAAAGSIMGIVAVTAMSRVYLGAHWPSDVLGAVAYGVPLLATLVWLRETLAKKWD